MYDVFNIDKLLQHGSVPGVLREFGSPYHISWRPGVQSSHLTTPSRFEQCEFNPNAEVMDPHQDVFFNESIWGNLSDAAQSGGFSLGWGLRSTEEILTPDNQSATIVADKTQPGGFRINDGICVNFEGFYNDSIGNASSPDSNGRAMGQSAWRSNRPPGVRLDQRSFRALVCTASLSRQAIHCNLPHRGFAKQVARVKTLVGRGIRAFYLDSHIAPGRLNAVLEMRRAFAANGVGKQLFLFRESTNDVDTLAMGQMPWYLLCSIMVIGVKSLMRKDTEL